VVYNVHQVIHLADEYKAFGPLDNISAFPYENYLGGLKRLVRKPDRPLQQVVKRLSEMLPKESHQPNGDLLLSSSSKELKKVHLSNCVLSPKQGDNCIKIDTDIAIVKDIIKQNESIHIVCQRFLKRVSFYTYPCDSSALGCYRVSVLQEKTEIVPLSSVKQKYVLLPENENVFFCNTPSPLQIVFVQQSEHVWCSVRLLEMFLQLNKHNILKKWKQIVQNTVYSTVS